MVVGVEAAPGRASVEVQIDTFDPAGSSKVLAVWTCLVY